MIKKLLFLLLIALGWTFTSTAHTTKAVVIPLEIVNDSEALLALNASGDSFDPLLTEGKSWLLRYSSVSYPEEPDYFEYSLSAARSIGDTQYWSLSGHRCTADGTHLNEPAIPYDGYLVGEQDGKLYFVEEDKPVLFMDFSLHAGKSLDFSHPVNGETVHVEVTAVSDTILAPAKDRSRHCLFVSYNGTESDVWVEGIGSLKYGVTFPLLLGATGGTASLAVCRNGDRVLYDAAESWGETQTVSVIHDSARADEAHTYDLQGRKIIGRPAHGLYIRQGRKVLVK